ncbi:hypothetical protein [Sulfitobacter geojensis]|uniref:hypothetical protein n=1 Tax=Sulfitobacter geojensis TaxID=1342299 RepID=UPI0036DD6CE5
MTDTAYEQILYVINGFSEEFSTARVQIDELAHLTEVCRNELPEKFIQLVESTDKNPPTSKSGLRTFQKRLEASLRMNAEFPIPPREKSPDVELLPTFSLSKPDKDRVLKLCDQMRKIIYASDAFDVPHKKRLLNRIAAIEKQVYSEKGLFDVVLGGVSDIGETFGKFGTDIKPLTDRIAEIRKITRSGSESYKQLPEPEETKSLPAPSESDDE